MITIRGSGSRRHPKVSVELWWQSVIDAWIKSIHPSMHRRIHPHPIVARYFELLIEWHPGMHRVCLWLQGEISLVLLHIAELLFQESRLTINGTVRKSVPRYGPVLVNASGWCATSRVVRAVQASLILAGSGRRRAPVTQG